MPKRQILACGVVLLALARPAAAGPPYVSDDPEPTDDGHVEIYAFDMGTTTRTGASGMAGVDFNYGPAPDLQLTAVLPVAYDNPPGGRTAIGFGNGELAAKYRFLHQEGLGWDVSVFPRVFLPSGSSAVGPQHLSLLVPIWLEKDWGPWSTFGGGGCELNRGGTTRNFCLAGWAVTRQVLADLQLGAEIYQQTADTKGGRDTAGVGLGLRYDLGDSYHLLAYGGPGIRNAAQTNRLTWYSALLLTF